MTELLGHTETRILLDVERYANIILTMGDVFHPDRDGVYDRITGECLLDFGRGGGFWIDNRPKGHGRKYRIDTIQDFENAKGSIYNHNGRMVVSARNISRIEVELERPLYIKAKEAAAAFVVEVIKNHHDYIMAGRNIPDLYELMYVDEILESSRRKEIYYSLERKIHSDLADDLNRYQWHDIWVSKSSGVYMLDVKTDIRIREWYEEKFKKQDIENERLRENGAGEYGDLRCT